MSLVQTLCWIVKLKNTSLMELQSVLKLPTDCQLLSTASGTKFYASLIGVKRRY